MWVNGDRYKGEKHRSQKGGVTKEQMKGQDLAWNQGEKVISE